MQSNTSTPRHGVIKVDVYYRTSLSLSLSLSIYIYIYKPIVVLWLFMNYTYEDSTIKYMVNLTNKMTKITTEVSHISHK